MLAQLEKPTNDFFALASYLINGRERPPHPDRVAWVRAHNLGTDDPMLAAKVMTATAEQSRRCRNACYHTIIAWRDDERPTPEIMQEIAARTLDLAGLGAHQALVMGHGDKAHPHLHMMINRVHPDTGRAWSTSHDWRRFDRIMRQLADDYGFAHVPCHGFSPEETDHLPKKPNSGATYAARRGAATTRTQWSAHAARRFSAEISEQLDAGSSWDDLEHLFADYGLALEAKGSGHVVGNATSYVKLSALGLQRTAKGFGRRPAVATSRSRKPARSHSLVDAVDIARSLHAMGLADRSAIKAAVDEAQARRLAMLAKKPLIKQLLADLGKKLAAWTALTPPFRPVKQRVAREKSTGVSKVSFPTAGSNQTVRDNC